MRTLPPGLAAHLARGVTTLCHCWRIETRAGERMGFTDHDEALAFDGTLFEADAGFSASEIESGLGLSVDNLEASGALRSGRITEERIARGDFDAATIEVWRVNWQDVAQRLLLKRGALGEVTRGAGFFTAELRGLAHALAAPQGRIFRFGCDAVLGDARCGVNLADPDLSAEVAILSQEEARRFAVSGALDFPDGFFTQGACAVLTGAAAGSRGRVKFHRLRNGAARVELWAALAQAPAPGDRLRLEAGCDQQFETCRMKFGNAVNFRGFPHMPGDDFITAPASHDGRGTAKRAGGA